MAGMLGFERGGIRALNLTEGRGWRMLFRSSFSTMVSLGVINSLTFGAMRACKWDAAHAFLSFINHQEVIWMILNLLPGTIKQFLLHIQIERISV